MAAGVVFYGLLALFPAVTAFVSLYGFFAQASSINEHLALVGDILPDGAVEIIQEQVTRIASKGETRLSLEFALGLGLALWSANAGMKALIDALNVSYDEKRSEGLSAQSCFPSADGWSDHRGANCGGRGDCGACGPVVSGAGGLRLSSVCCAGLSCFS